MFSFTYPIFLLSCASFRTSVLVMEEVLPRFFSSLAAFSLATSEDDMLKMYRIPLKSTKKLITKVWVQNSKLLYEFMNDKRHYIQDLIFDFYF